MLSELFQFVISCKILTSSMKFKFLHKIAVIQKKFLLLFNLMRGPDITHCGGRIRSAGSASLFYIFCPLYVRSYQTHISSHNCQQHTFSFLLLSTLPKKTQLLLIVVCKRLSFKSV